MQKKLAFASAAALLWLVVAAGAATLKTGAQAADAWEYSWEVRADGTSQVFRRPAADPAGDWLPGGVVVQEIVEIVGSQPDPGMVIARTRQTLFRSDDAGQRWEQISGLPDWPTALALGREQEELMYLGTLTGGVYRSIDGGTTWQALPWDLEMLSGPFLEVTALAIHPSDDEIVYAAAGHWPGSGEQTFTPSGVVVSRDGGETWQVFYRAKLGDARLTGLEPDPRRPERLQVVSEDGVEWLSGEDAVMPDATEGGLGEGDEHWPSNLKQTLLNQHQKHS